MFFAISLKSFQKHWAKNKIGLVDTENSIWIASLIQIFLLRIPRQSSPHTPHTPSLLSLPQMIPDHNFEKRACALC